jgi:hypothetical protein
MPVYTTVEQDGLVDFLGHYRAGEPVAFAGSGDGIEDSGYCVTTSRQCIDHRRPLTG